MKSNLYIPKVLKVGYNNRSDTYAGKLAYVTYIDEKGKLRKEASWNRWKNNNIPVDTFNNEPLSGFVLNKKAGDYTSHWNHRQAYCRIYDPREFEIEITIENLLFILENTNSIIGKGLEGDFVYSWSGKDLVLLPTSAIEYKEAITRTKIINKQEFIKPNNLVVGHTYLTKDDKQYIYLGRYDIYNTVYLSKNDKPYYISREYDKYLYNNGLYYWFSEVNNTHWFDHWKSPSNKFIDCINNTVVDNYVELHEKLMANGLISPNKAEFSGELAKVNKKQFNKDIKLLLNGDIKKLNYYYMRLSSYLYTIELTYNKLIDSIRVINIYNNSMDACDINAIDKIYNNYKLYNII